MRMSTYLFVIMTLTDDRWQHEVSFIRTVFLYRLHYCYYECGTPIHLVNCDFWKFNENRRKVNCGHQVHILQCIPFATRHHWSINKANISSNLVWVALHRLEGTQALISFNFALRYTDTARCCGAHLQWSAKSIHMCIAVTQTCSHTARCVSNTCT